MTSQLLATGAALFAVAVFGAPVPAAAQPAALDLRAAVSYALASLCINQRVHAEVAHGAMGQATA